MNSQERQDLYSKSSFTPKELNLIEWITDRYDNTIKALETKVEQLESEVKWLNRKSYE